MIKKVVYILDIFPAISETFILNEIKTVQKFGAQVCVFSRKASQDDLIHSGAEEFQDKIQYLDDPESISLKKIVSNHIILFVKHPISYLRTFIYAIRHRKEDMFWYFKISGCYAILVERENPSHIHAHFASLAGEFAMFISMILNVPYTFTAHGWHDIYKFPPLDFSKRAKEAKRVITVSQYNKNYIAKKYAIPPEKIDVIHCGIKPELFHHNGRNVNKTIRILSVSRLHPIKGVAHLVRACRFLKDKQIDFLCSIIGEGELRKEITDLIGELGLENQVKLEGAKTAGEVRDYYARSDIYVNSSLCEGLSVSIMEAMSSRLPVVATNVTGIVELIEHTKNGYLVQPEDARALAKSIEQLIHDEQKRIHFGEVSYKKIQSDFTLEKEVQKLMDVWFDKSEQIS